MSKIARKTKTETVSMKIITLVTLFFLPGTFIAVSGLLLIYLVSHCTVALGSPNTCSLHTSPRACTSVMQLPLLSSCQSLFERKREPRTVADYELARNLDTHEHGHHSLERWRKELSSWRHAPVPCNLPASNGCYLRCLGCLPNFRKA